MREIIIQVDSKEDEALLLNLASRLKLTAKKKRGHVKKNGAIAMRWLDEIAKRGGINIDNPVAWQRSIRKDRIL